MLRVNSPARPGRARRPGPLLATVMPIEKITLFCFGASYALALGLELVQMFWGKLPVDYRVPDALNFSAFTLFATNYPAFRMFMLLMSVAVFIGLLLLLTRTRVGLIIRAALTHPAMVGALAPGVGALPVGAGDDSGL